MAKKQYITNPRDIRRFKKKKLVTTTRNNNLVGVKPGPNPRVPCPPNEWPCGWYWTGDGPGQGSLVQQCCGKRDTTSVGRTR